MEQIPTDLTRMRTSVAGLHAQASARIATTTQMLFVMTTMGQGDKTMQQQHGKRNRLELNMQ